MIPISISIKVNCNHEWIWLNENHRKCKKCGLNQLLRDIPAKCDTLQNYRFILRCIDELGLILRNIIIWYKPNHLPESVKDRFTHSYEPVFMLTKSKKYYFDLDAVREPLKSFTEHDMERILKHGKFLNPVLLGYNSKFLDNPSALADSTSFNYRVREAKKGHFEKIGVRASEEEMKKYDNQGKYKQNWNEIKSNKETQLTLGGSGRFHIWKRNVRKLTKHDLAVGRIDNFNYSDPLHTKPYNIIGKNPGDVWTINTQPFKDAHFATFPEELVRRCILAACPENGLVLDPFVGSGTTIKVAIEKRRDVIGIDIVPEYIEMTIKRCNLRNNPLIDFEFVNLKIKNSEK